jgi:hypothetical protein
LDFLDKTPELTAVLGLTGLAAAGLGQHDVDVFTADAVVLVERRHLFD